MTTLPPRAAMLLAAGLGTRMRPLSEDTAKPLLPIAGRPLIDRALDRLADAGVDRVVVNAHWRAPLVAAHLAARASRPPQTILLEEAELLGTGGAVAAALALPEGPLRPGPFFVVNGDSLWLDGPTPALERLAAAFDPATDDAVLLVHRAFQVQAETGSGDFALDPWGVPRRPNEREIVPYVYAGVQLVTPALFGDAHAGHFDMNPCWDRALAAGRLRCVVHDGLWFHISTPADLRAAEEALMMGATGESR